MRRGEAAARLTLRLRSIGPDLVAERLGRTHRHYSVVVHLDDETAAPAEKPADERIALDDDRMRVLMDLDPEPLGHPRLEELVEGAPPTAAGIGLTSHDTTVPRSARPGGPRP